MEGFPQQIDAQAQYSAAALSGQNAANMVPPPSMSMDPTLYQQQLQQQQAAALLQQQQHFAQQQLLQQQQATAQLQSNQAWALQNLLSERERHLASLPTSRSDGSLHGELLADRQHKLQVNALRAALPTHLHGAQQQEQEQQQQQQQQPQQQGIQWSKMISQGLKKDLTNRLM